MIHELIINGGFGGLINFMTNNIGKNIKLIYKAIQLIWPTGMVAIIKC